MIPTGIPKLDEFLNGGISPGLLVDIFGPNATGKTQITSQVIANCLSQNRNVLFHDTKGEFRPERILDMLNAKGLPEKLLDNIDVKRITNSSEQINSIRQDIDPKYSLLVIDDITELFSYEYSENNKLLEKNILLMKYMYRLALMSTEKNIPVIFTNTIRNQDGTEVENIAKAVEPFTHIKIQLAKINNKFKGESSYLTKKLIFFYIITGHGVLEVS